MAEEMEYTLAMIKPDAVAAGKASEIQQLAEMHGFLIIAKRQLQVPAIIVIDLNSGADGYA
jgi:nucleoside diphosphate kinase